MLHILRTWYRCPRSVKIIISGENTGGVQIKKHTVFVRGKHNCCCGNCRSHDSDARSAIKKMIQVMEGFQVTNAFSRAICPSSREEQHVLLVKTVDDLLAVPTNIKTFAYRVTVWFSPMQRVKKIYIQEYKADGWKTNLFVTILKANQEVKFLGRIKDWHVPVTLKDGTIAQLDVKSGRREPAIKTFDGVIKTSAYIGEVFGGKHAVISGNQLVTA